MQLFWTIVSALCLSVSAYFFFWRGNNDMTFIVATLGIIAWFLKVRIRFKAAANAREKEMESIQEDES